MKTATLEALRSQILWCEAHGPEHAELAECLPETYRAIWTLGDVEQLTMEEIAAILDINVPNV